MKDNEQSGGSQTIGIVGDKAKWVRHIAWLEDYN